MPTTSNFGWTTPADTDLVKDGALAIRTLGNNIDTSLVDLKGGTTGQVLAKATNTDLDYTWVTPDDADAIQNAIVDAKGDLISATAADTPARLAVGANETRLVADSATATGLKYVADTTNYAIAAKGDLLAGTAADTLAALSVGTNNYFLTPDSTTATGLKWGGDWTTWTPTYTNLTVGNGTVTARYVKIGKTVYFDYKIIFGSTTTMSGVPRFTLPSTSKSDVFFFDGNILDSGVANYNGAGQVVANTNEVYWKVYSVGGTYLTAGNVSQTAPMTWTTNDEYMLHGFYEET